MIIPMGAPWSVYDQEAIGTWVPTELAMLREAHDQQVPVLGICFGGQLLAAAHGGSVSRSPAPEIGWVEVKSDNDGLVPSGFWFQGTTTSGSRLPRRRKWHVTPSRRRPSFSAKTSPCSFIPR